MNARSCLFVGLCLLGVYLLTQVLIGLPEIAMIARGAPGSPLLMMAICPPALQLVAGLFLVLKADAVSRALAARLEASAT